MIDTVMMWVFRVAGVVCVCLAPVAFARGLMSAPGPGVAKGKPPLRLRLLDGVAYLSLGVFMWTLAGGPGSVERLIPHLVALFGGMAVFLTCLVWITMAQRRRAAPPAED
jgi:hypothetical protein